MNEEEYNRKYANLRILKGIQEYLNPEKKSPTAVYPISIPDELLYQMMRLKGAEETDKLIHHIFRKGLNLWSENLYNEEFGSQENLEKFIRIVKERNSD